MKTKTITRAAALYMAVVTLMLCSLTVFAVESYKKPGAYVADYFYIYDETMDLDASSRTQLLDTMQKLFDTTGCCVGVFFGKNSRTHEEVEELAKDGAEDMFLTYSTDGAFFIYLDYDSNNDVNTDYIYCAGKASDLLPDEQDAVNNILKSTKKNYTDSSQGGVSYNMVRKASYVILLIDNYCSEPPQFSNIETVSEYSEYLDNANPDEYILSVIDDTSNGSYSTSKSGSSKEYTSDRVYIYDEGGMFSDAQAQKLMTSFEGTAREIGFNLILYAATKSRSDSSVESKAKSLARMSFPKSGYTGSVCLYIDLDGYKNAYDYMFCYNDAFLYYTNGDDGTEDRVKKILHAMQAYFPAGGQKIVMTDIMSGLEEYLKQLVSYKAKGLVEGIYYTDPTTGEYVYASGEKIVHSNSRPYKYWWAGLLIGLAAGAIVAAIASTVVKKRYKFKSSTSASVYTSREKIFMRNSQDIFIGSHVSKVRIQSSSSHGGHGGGGGHVGGGGGGSHR